MAILLGELDISRLTNLIVGEGIEATKRFSGVVLSFLEEKQPTNRIAGLIRKNVISDLKLGEEGNSARKSVSSLATAVPGLTKSEFVAEILRRSELAIEEVDECHRLSLAGQASEGKPQAFLLILARATLETILVVSVMLVFMMSPMVDVRLDWLLRNA